MFKNYLLVALRSLFRHPVYSSINLFGLTIGIACCLLILTFVRYEMSFDKDFSGADRIYRVVGQAKSPDSGQLMHVANVMYPALPQMGVEYPEIEYWARLQPTTLSVINGEKRFNEDLMLADKDFFQLFDFRFLQGNPDTALVEPLSIVLTESTAKKYFGRTDVLGETLSLENRFNAEITGVIEDTAGNVHFELDLVISMESFRSLLPAQEVEITETMWASLGATFGYFKLKPGETPDRITNDLRDFTIRNAGAQSAAFEQDILSISLQPLTDIHLNPRLNEPAFDRMSHFAVVFAAVILAGLILLIAIFNFINLTTARASLRAKEIGLRKVLGASKGNLVLQFLCETLVITTLATLIAIGVVELIKPWFGSLIFRNLGAISLLDAGHWFYLVILVLITTVLAGGYPAFVLSRSLPAIALKGGENSSHKGRLRKALVISQFTVSIILVIATQAAQNQMNYLKNMDLGFNKDQIVSMSAGSGDMTSLKLVDELAEQYAEIRTELLRNPEVLSVAFSTAGFPGGFSGKSAFGPPGADVENLTLLGQNFIDYQFLETFDATFIAGRNFSKDMPTDIVDMEQNMFLPSGGSAILTMDGIKKMGWSTPEEALDKEIMSPAQNGKPARVIGVIENIQGMSGYMDLNPEIFFYNPTAFATISVKLSGSRTADTLKHLETVWNRFIPNQAAHIVFVDDGYEQLHQIFNKVIKGFTLFASLAVLIACLGLYAMASFTAERRTKEIGVRKVMGASTLDITKLLLWDFSKPVIMALVIALPLAFLMMSTILQAFPQPAPLGVALFVIATVGTLLIAWLTVASHTVRVASSNPTNALRYE